MHQNMFWTQDYIWPSWISADVYFLPSAPPQKKKKRDEDDKEWLKIYKQ